MKIHSYIQQHGLTHVRTYSLFSSDAGEGISELLVETDNPSDTFEIYSDPTRRHVVSINTRRNLFRVARWEIAPLYSQWLSLESDHLLDALVI